MSATDLFIRIDQDQGIDGTAANASLDGGNLTFLDSLAGDHDEAFVVEIEVIWINGDAVAVTLAKVPHSFNLHRLLPNPAREAVAIIGANCDTMPNELMVVPFARFLQWPDRCRSTRESEDPRRGAAEVCAEDHVCR